MYETYPEEFFLLQRQIIMRKTDEYIMQTSIIANPHKSPDEAKEFIDDLMSRRRFYRGEEEVTETLDVSAFMKFKDQMSQDSNLIKVK